MVHRPPDSRLLTNLLSQEKEFTKHLNSLLDSSHSSQSSFSAYAAASSPPTSRVILAVAASLAGADDALTAYLAAVEQWREHLKGLKALEDEVGNIIRDRQILVTRLIKASKSHKPPRDTRASMLLPQNQTSSSSLSLASNNSPSSSKLVSAQSELQACEAHLASKERQLTLARATAVRDGLNLRLTALVQCGESWAQMGTQGLHALQSLSSNDTRPNFPEHHPSKPLPLLLDSSRPSSDISHSSLAPSQSASQIGAPTSQSTLHAPVYQNGDANLGPSHTQIHIPPPHAIGDFSIPSTSRPASPPPHTQRITEADPKDDSSVEEDQDLQVKVVDNPRFQPKSGPPPAQGSRVRKFSLLGTTHRDKDKDASSVSDKLPSGSSFFGSLRGIFVPHRRDASVSSFDVPPSPPVKGATKRGKWSTRTEKNLKALKKEASASDDDQDQDRGRPGLSLIFDSPPASPSRRLKKSRQGRSASVPPPSPTGGTLQKPPSPSTPEQVPTTSVPQHGASRSSSLRSDARGKGKARVGHRRTASVSDAPQAFLHLVSPYPPASLMGVVQDTRSQSYPNLGEVVKAPPRVGKREILSSYGGGGVGMGGPDRERSTTLRAPRSVFDTEGEMTSSVSAPVRRPAKSPLRSALRNSSRSPSPLPVVKKIEEEGDGDGASISSYETGRETFFDGEERPLLLNGGVLLQESDVSTSTERGGGVQRRKSVRVSLKPTYAAAPPPVVFVEQESDDVGVRKGKGVGVVDMWEDSSEEDEEYAIARKLLARVGKGKGKGRGY